MNETALIRQQLALERAHLAAVARACAAAHRGRGAGDGPGAAAPSRFHQACVAYLTCVLHWHEARDLRLQGLAAGLGSQDPRCATVTAILARSGGSAEALARLSAAGADLADWDRFVTFLAGPWSERRDALELLLAHDSRPADWRLISGIDADSILEERTRLARVTALLPEGVSLAAAPVRDALRL